MFALAGVVLLPATEKYVFRRLNLYFTTNASLLILVLIIAGGIYSMNGIPGLNFNLNLADSIGKLEFFKLKPTLDCRVQQCDSAQLSKIRSECQDYVVITDSSNMTLREEYGSSNDYCIMNVQIINSSISRLEGLSMNCNIPKDKITQTSGSWLSGFEGLKYCSGSMKEFATDPSQWFG